MLSSPLSETQLAAQNALTLAAVGDSVFDLMVRTRLCADGTVRAGDLHKRRVGVVNARAQAKAAEALAPLMTAEEADVFRRGRNAQPGSIPQAASRAEYQAATALEALFGWLYLGGRYDRLRELFNTLFPAGAGEPFGGDS